MYVIITAFFLFILSPLSTGLPGCARRTACASELPNAWCRDLRRHSVCGRRHGSASVQPEYASWPGAGSSPTAGRPPAGACICAALRRATHLRRSDSHTSKAVKTHSTFIGAGHLSSWAEMSKNQHYYTSSKELSAYHFRLNFQQQSSEG